MKRTLIGAGLTLMASALIVGCNNNSDSGDSGTTTVTVTPSLGKIKNARVKLFNAQTGSVIGNVDGVDVDDNGKAQFTNVPVGVPVIASVLPKLGANTVTYFDEAEQTDKTVTSTQLGTLRAVVPAVVAGQNVGVTSFTEAAASTLQIPSSNIVNNAQSVIANANASIQQKIKTQYQTDVNILTAPTIVGSAAEMNSLANNANGQYAGLLALAAETVKKLKGVSGPKPTALRFLENLRNDAADGTLDGMSNGASVDVNLFSPDFAAAQTSAAQSLQTSLKNLGALFTNITFSGGSSSNCTDCGSVVDGDNVTHMATSVAVVTVNNLKTITWSDGMGALSLMLNATTGEKISLSETDNTGANFLSCANNGCPGVTVDAANKTVTFSNVTLQPLGGSGTAVMIKSGTLKFNVSTSASGGFNVAVGGTVTAADLAKLAGSFNGNGVLTSTSSANPMNPSVSQITCSASINASGQMSVSGGGVTQTVAPSNLSIVANSTATVNGQQVSVKSVTLYAITQGSAETATAVFDGNGKLVSITGTSSTFTQTVPPVTTTRLLSCTITP